MFANIRWSLPLLIVVSLAFPVAAVQENNQPPEGFRALFNGKNLSGWHGEATMDPRKLAAMPAEELAEFRKTSQADADQHWSVEDGEIVNDGHGVYLTTDQDFRDYELWIDYKTVAGADSGIYLKRTPQVQIWDATEAGGKWSLGADKGSGGLWNNSDENPGKYPSVLADKPFGEWNRFRIVQVGDRTSIWLNGQQVVDRAVLENYWDKNTPVVAAGPIQLQTHGGEIRWRNVFVREFSPEESADWLTAADDDQFDSIFNGVDFSGWAGPTDNYEVEDGVLRCRPHQGGTIYTEKAYDDFSVRFEFKLPPGGNNGLAIRYPGEGDAAYSAMCELQVLDNEDLKYAQLDPRQYHGSAYGMVAAHRGYLREPGEWNFQQVTVQGSRIIVELNGTTILDTDLAEITEYMHDQPHPGKDRASGHFGFAGHSDPVEFRHIRLRSLNR